MAESCVLLKGLLSSAGKEHEVSLSESGLQWIIPPLKPDAAPGVFEVIWKDIYGVASDDEMEAKKYFIIHYINHRKDKKWKATEKKFEVNEGSVTDWVTQIQARFRPGTPRNLLVIVNPIGGKGDGRNVYEKKVAPLFKMAGINAQVQYTERSKHIEEMINSFDFTKVDGLVTVGGDGTYQEAINTLIQRIQKEAGIDINNPSVKLKPIEGVKFGIIPAGTGNGVAKWCCGTNDIETSVLHIIRGDTNDYNIMAVYEASKFLVFSGLLFGYGMVSDIIKETDEKRWMKRLRYPYVMLTNFLGKKTTYTADVEYLEADISASPIEEDSQGAASLPPHKDWKKVERKKWMDMMGFVADLDTSGDKIVINPSSDGTCFILSEKCSGLSHMGLFISVFGMGNKQGLKAPHLTVLKNIVGLRICVPPEVQKSSRENTQHILDIDGEVVRIEDLSIEIRLIPRFIPLFSSPVQLPSSSSSS